MFISTYRNTLKSLLRSVTFWLTAFIFCFIVLPSMSGDFQDNRLVDEWNYAQYVSNLFGTKVLMYALPILAITLAAVTLSSDYGDGFYEIEKAKGVRSSTYLLGRIFAISAVALSLSAIVSFICVYGYVYSNGGVVDRSFAWLLVDSVLRVGAFNLFMVLPSILFYVGLTYLFGTLFRSGLAGAGVGFVHVIVYYVLNLMYRHNPDLNTYFDFLSPIPRHLRHFLQFSCGEGGAEFLLRNGTTAPKALLCVGFLLGCAALFLLGSWLRLRKREI